MITDHPRPHHHPVALHTPATCVFPLLLVRVTKELASKHDILVPVGKVPAHNCWVLTTAYDPAGVKLEFEDA
jgi:hypothetical protein